MTQPPGSASSPPPGQPAVPYHLWRQQNGFPAGNAAPSSINGAGAGAAAPDPRLALLRMYMNYKAAAAAAPAAGIASHPTTPEPVRGPFQPSSVADARTDESAGSRSFAHSSCLIDVAGLVDRCFIVLLSVCQRRLSALIACVCLACMWSDLTWMAESAPDQAQAQRAAMFQWWLNSPKPAAAAAAPSTHSAAPNAGPL